MYIHEIRVMLDGGWAGLAAEVKGRRPVIKAKGERDVEVDAIGFAGAAVCVRKRMSLA